MFFGMQPRRGQNYQYRTHSSQQQRQQQQQYQEGGNANYAQLVQLMPLLLLFLFSFLGNQAGGRDLPFRLQRTPPEFTFRRETASSGTPYYVQGNFDQIYSTRNKVRNTFAGRLHNPARLRLCKAKRAVLTSPPCRWLLCAFACDRAVQVKQVEKEVDKHYLNNQMNECRREKVQQRQMMQEARCVLPQLLLRV